MVWLALAMVKACGTSAAGLKLLSPACDAVTVQEPALVRWTVEPVTVQLPVAAKVTARAEDAVALTLKSGSPKFLLARARSEERRVGKECRSRCKPYTIRKKIR